MKENEIVGKKSKLALDCGNLLAEQEGNQNTLFVGRMTASCTK